MKYSLHTVIIEQNKKWKRKSSNSSVRIEQMLTIMVGLQQGICYNSSWKHPFQTLQKSSIFLKRNLIGELGKIMN